MFKHFFGLSALKEQTELTVNSIEAWFYQAVQQIPLI
jgi:hypothetical protein